MKFFLTIYICSVMCATMRRTLPMDKHDYDKFYGTHYECIQKGLGESYSILFDSEILDP
jgi:hypothetical protein